LWLKIPSNRLRRRTIEYIMEAVTTERPRLRMDEESIIRRCQEGDLMAYHAIYERYKQPLLRTALRILGQKQDAEDAVQDAFLKLYRSINNYKRGSKFSTYLFRILLNSCFDILRKRGRAVFKDTETEDLPYYPAHESYFNIEHAIEALPQQMRICFVLFAVEEFGQEEIAQILNKSLGTVKATVHRAKARLRSLLSDSRMEVKA
jgi:RNA polymerase sigma-70 factor (ECF subfamily)